MNNRLTQLPFLRLLVPFIVGIILGINIPGIVFFFYLSVLFILFYFSLHWYESRKFLAFRYRWVPGTLASACLITLGYALVTINSTGHSKDYYGRFIKNGVDTIWIRIESMPAEKHFFTKSVAEVTGVNYHGQLKNTSGKILIYFRNDSNIVRIKYGDMLIIYTELKPISSPLFPDEFDYKNYLDMHGIDYECYVPERQCVNTGKNGASLLMQITSVCREKLILLINTRIRGNEAALATAILLGYREELSPDIVQFFADSGTVHIICVAGLHVGIIFWFLSICLAFLDNVKYGKLLRVALILFLVWIYAFLTGLAIPVIRASIMFSFLLIGKHFSKDLNPVNTLAASAFLILLINPFNLADTGFQLSYLSVLGILVMYPPLSSLLKTGNYWIVKLWHLACLSISAQVAIIPLTLLYFHQFPIYFIFVNLLVVPLLFVIIISGLLFLITTNLPLVGIAITWVFQKCLWILNFIVMESEKLPLHVIKGISVTYFEALLLYACICVFLLYCFSRKYIYLFLTLCGITFVFGMNDWEYYIHSKQQLIEVYGNKGFPAVAIISGFECMIVSPDNNAAFFQIHLHEHWIKSKIEHTRYLRWNVDTTAFSGQLKIQHGIVEFNHRRFKYIDDTENLKENNQKLIFDYLIVSDGFSRDINTLQANCNFQMIIFDTSPYSSKCKGWKNECNKLHIPFYDLHSEGAFITEC